MARRRAVSRENAFPQYGVIATGQSPAGVGDRAVLASIASCTRHDLKTALCKPGTLRFQM